MNTQSSVDREARVRHVMETFPRLVEAHRRLILQLKAGSSVQDIADSSKISVREILRILGVVYERLGLNVPPSTEDREIMRAGLAAIKDGVKSTSTVHASQPVEELLRETPPPSVRRRPKRGPRRSRREIVEMSAAQTESSDAPALEKLNYPELAKRIRLLPSRQREVLPFVVQGLRGEELRAAIGYGSANSAEAAASGIRSALGIPQRRGGRIGPNHQERTEIIRKIWETYLKLPAKP